MHPIILQIGSFTIYSYGLMVAVAFIVSSGLAQIYARRKHLNPQIIANLSFMVMIAGIIGARIFYVAMNIHEYLNNPVEILMLQHGGLAWFGGLLAGTIAGVVYLKLKRQKLYPIIDLLAPFVALGQAIGRIGCFLNGCCFGRISHHGMYFASDQQIRIPTQLYSSALLFIIFIVLLIVSEKPHRQGEIFFLYLLLYAVKRFGIEFFRADNTAVLFGLTLFQVLSIAVFFIAVINLILIKRGKT